MKVNSMYFYNLEDALALIKHLSELSIKDNNLYSDIHVYPEEGSFIVEWAQLPYDHSYGGNFKYVGEEEEVLTYKTFPDNSGDYFRDEEEFKVALDDWLAENPKWKRNQFGRWYEEE